VINNYSRVKNRHVQSGKLPSVEKGSSYPYRRKTAIDVNYIIKHSNKMISTIFSWSKSKVCQISCTHVISFLSYQMFEDPAQHVYKGEGWKTQAFLIEDLSGSIAIWAIMQQSKGFTSLNSHQLIITNCETKFQSILLNQVISSSWLSLAAWCPVQNGIHAATEIMGHIVNNIFNWYNVKF